MTSGFATAWLATNANKADVKNLEKEMHFKDFIMSPVTQLKTESGSDLKSLNSTLSIRIVT
jgi:hypothetical protein